VQRWKLGNGQMNSLHSGLANSLLSDLIGIQLMFFLLPLFDAVLQSPLLDRLS